MISVLVVLSMMYMVESKEDLENIFRVMKMEMKRKADKNTR